MNCDRLDTGWIWLLLVMGFFALIIYWIVSSKMEARRKAKIKSEALPLLPLGIRLESTCNLSLKDGQRLDSVKLLGVADDIDESFAVSGWGDMLVLMKPNGKRTFVRQNAVRMIEEL